MDKLERYRAERNKSLAKIDFYQARVKELDQKITAYENQEIRALMRAENMTITDLMTMLREMQEQRRASIRDIVSNDKPIASDIVSVTNSFTDEDRSAAYHGYEYNEENDTNDEI